MREYIVSETAAGAFRILPEALEALKNEEKRLAEKEAVRIVIKGMQHLAKPLRITAEQLPNASHPVFCGRSR